MSDLLDKTRLSDSKDCPPCSIKPVHQKITVRKATIGDGVTIRRAMPHRERRMVGAWCFLDHFGPLDLKNTNGLNVAPHPHIGLQTFTWTLQGEILHKDSLGSKQLIQPGQVNLMTAGGGIAHSEESQPDTTLHGVQLWIALPEGERNRPADFIHYPNIPVINHDGLNIYLLAGELLGKTAPVKVYSPLTGMDIHAVKDTTTTIPLNPAYEYGILPLIGHIELENETVDQEAFMYLGAGRSELNIHVPQDARILIIGGKPFDEEILVWWNFVARTTEEIVTAADQWNNHERFGEVIGYEGGRLTAPTPTVNLK